MAKHFPLDQLVDKLKSIGDKNRLRILALLKDGEHCVCDLTEVLGISQPGVSQQMRKLKQAGLVKERRGGQWTYYSLNLEEPLLEVFLPLIPDIPEDKEILQKYRSCSID